jgi:hypothetical protein
MAPASQSFSFTWLDWIVLSSSAIFWNLLSSFKEAPVPDSNCVCQSLFVSVTKYWDRQFKEEWFIYVFIYFGGTGVWTEGLVLASQMLYHLSHAHSPFCFCFFHIGSHVFPGQPLTLIFLSLPPKWAEYNCELPHIPRKVFLAHIFGDFSPWSFGPIAFGPMWNDAEHHDGEHVVEKSGLPGGKQWDRKGPGTGYPSKATPPNFYHLY